MPPLEFDEIEPEDYCDIAIEQAFKLCKDKEYAFKSIAKCYGFGTATFDQLDLNTSYLEIIEEGIDTEDIESLNRYLVAIAWKYYMVDNKELLESFANAWEVAMDKWHGE